VTESLTDIRIFVAAYEERSFTTAAIRENATQSGVSQHIRKLEEAYKVKLFSRDKGQVVPTPAGDAFYAQCIQALRALQSGKDAVKSFAGVSGDVYVGLMPTMTRAALAPSIRRIVREHPNAVVHVMEAYSPILTQRVVSGELDFAIVPAFAGGPGLRVERFLRTWEALVSNPSRGAHLSPARLRDCGPLKLVLPSRANTRRKTLDEYFALNEVAVERLIEMDAMMGTLDFVATSDWVTILPALMMTVEIENRQFSVRPIVDPLASLDLVWIEPTRRALGAAARAFLDIIREEAERLNRAWIEPFGVCLARGGD
jgi:DNA-binding transcriptional LysR family regulator